MIARACHRRRHRTRHPRPEPLSQAGEHASSRRPKIQILENEQTSAGYGDVSPTTRRDAESTWVPAPYALNSFVSLTLACICCWSYCASVRGEATQSSARGCSRLNAANAFVSFAKNQQHFIQGLWRCYFVVAQTLDNRQGTKSPDRLKVFSSQPLMA